jgi:protease secretion system outer membrane protein
MMRTKWLLACAFAYSNVWAGSLQSGFEAALAHDPQYRSARAELASAQQASPMARAALRPNVSISWSDSNVKGNLNTDSGGFSTARELDYRSPVRSLTVRMPLYNREASRKLEIADVQAAYSERVFAVRTADLMDRFAIAIFQRSVARHSVRSAQAQMESAQAQRNQALRSYELGDGPRTSAQEAEASLGLAIALLSEGRNQLTQANLALQQMTGLDDEQVESLEDPLAFRSHSSANVVPGESLDEWLTKAEAQSPSIAARRIAVDIAKASIERNSSGHYPRLDFVASATNSHNESVNTLNQTIDQNSMGLQLNLPLYSGGYVSASVTQALADQEKAEADLESERQSVKRSITKLYFSGQDGMAKAIAYQRILLSLQSTLDGQRLARLAGLVSQTEVISAEGKVAQAKVDAAKAWGEFILARVQLITKAGGEAEQALQVIENILKTSL